MAEKPEPMATCSKTISSLARLARRCRQNDGSPKSHENRQAGKGLGPPNFEAHLFQDTPVPQNQRNAWIPRK